VLRLYDGDKSGAFSFADLKIVLHAVYPHLDEDGVSQLMESVGWRLELNVAVSPDELQATLLAWRDGQRTDTRTCTTLPIARMKTVRSTSVVKLPLMARRPVDAHGLAEEDHVLQSALLTTSLPPPPPSRQPTSSCPPATMSGASRAMIAAQLPPEADGQPTELSRLDRIGSLLFELTDDAEPPAQPDSLPMALKGYDERGGAQRPAAREAHKEGHRRNSNKGSHREHKEAKDNRQESDAYKNRLNKLMSISQPQGLGDQGKGKSSSRSRSSLPLPDETEDV